MEGKKKKRALKCVRERNGVEWGAGGSVGWFAEKAELQAVRAAAVCWREERGSVCTAPFLGGSWVLTAVLKCTMPAPPLLNEAEGPRVGWREGGAPGGVIPSTANEADPSLIRLLRRGAGREPA